jgi:hypothetical protein
LIGQTQNTPKAAGEARDFTIRNIPAGQWRNIHDELELVAGKERASVKYDQTNDRLLRATYDCFPDRNNSLWPKETPRPQFYLWDLTHGPTEDIRAQFVGIANRIGKLLGCPQGTDPLDFALYRLQLDLEKNKSSYLYGADEDGGIILYVCEALVAFCSRLAAESEATEPTAAPQPTEGYPGETTESGLPKPVREGKRCAKVIDEVKRIKTMYNGGMSMKEIKEAWPNYEVWKTVEGLSKEDREVFERSAQWGAATGYAKLILSKCHGNSPDTITDWVKAYKKHEKSN